MTATLWSSKTWHASILDNRSCCEVILQIRVLGIVRFVERMLRTPNHMGISSARLSIPFSTVFRNDQDLIFLDREILNILRKNSFENAPNLFDAAAEIDPIRCHTYLREVYPKEKLASLDRCLRIRLEFSVDRT